MNKRQSFWILAIIAIFGMLWAFLSEQNNKKNSESDFKSFQYPIMGTVVELKFFENAETAEKAAKAAGDALRNVQTICNLFDPASELSQLNAQAATTPFVASPELYQILKAAQNAWGETGGGFDITAKPLMDLWGFYRKRNQTPTAEEIADTLKKVGMDKVVFDDEKSTVFFTVPGMAFDLGGIAKGLAVDAAVDAAKAAGARNGIINLGGNLACFGKPAKDREFFEIGIRNPIKPDETIATLQLYNEAIATSGNYERFVILDGKRYAHIMNPKTGYPVENMLSVSIKAPLALTTDIYSTGVFIGGETLARKLVEQNPALEFILFYLDESGNMIQKNINQSNKNEATK